MPDTGYWLVATSTMLGELRHQEVQKILQMTQRFDLIQSWGPATTAMLKETKTFYEGFAEDMKWEARQHWKTAVKESELHCIESEWTQRAKSNLAQH